jgi:hypothetical protein
MLIDTYLHAVGASVVGVLLRCVDVAVGHVSGSVGLHTLHINTSNTSDFMRQMAARHMELGSSKLDSNRSGSIDQTGIFAIRLCIPGWRRPSLRCCQGCGWRPGCSSPPSGPGCPSHPSGPIEHSDILVWPGILHCRDN